jgi:hypothetical protein
LTERFRPPQALRALPLSRMVCAPDPRCRATPGWNSGCFWASQLEGRMLSQESSGLSRAIEPHHHGRIEELLNELHNESYGEDPRELCAAWSRFDRELQAHLRDEETYILPAFSDANPDEARAILAEHAEIRRLTVELGIHTELHAIRAQTIEQLLARLREHAQREDAVMYPWAASHLA